MIYDTFLFTRDDKKDYGFRIKPDYVSNDLYKKAGPIIDLIRYTDDNAFLSGLIFFFRFDGVSYISRIFHTGSIDGFGRPIFSFEGLAINDVSKRVLLDIPNVIKYIESHSESLRVKYYSEESNSISAQVEIDSDINVLLTKDNADDGNDCNYTSYDNFLHNISQYVYDYNIVYGKGAMNIKQYLTKSFQTMAVCDVTSDIARTNKSIKAEYTVIGNDISEVAGRENAGRENVKSVDIKIVKTKKGFGYSFVLDDKLNDNIEPFDEKEKINIAELKQKKDKLNLYLLLTGR